MNTITTMITLLMTLSPAAPPRDPAGKPPAAATATFADAVRFAIDGQYDEAEATFLAIATAHPAKRSAATANLAWIALQRADMPDTPPAQMIEHLRAAEASYLSIARSPGDADPRVLASLADVRRRIRAAEQQAQQQVQPQQSQDSDQGDAEQSDAAAERAEQLQDLAERQQQAADSNGSQPDRQAQQDALNQETEQVQNQQGDPSLDEARAAQERAAEAMRRSDEQAARQAQREAAEALQEAADRAAEQASESESSGGRQAETTSSEQAESRRAEGGEPRDPAAELAERILQREQQRRERGRPQRAGPGTQPVETDW